MPEAAWVPADSREVTKGIWSLPFAWLPNTQLLNACGTPAPGHRLLAQPLLWGGRAACFAFPSRAETAPSHGPEADCLLPASAFLKAWWMNLHSREGAKVRVPLPSWKLWWTDSRTMPLQPCLKVESEYETSHARLQARCWSEWWGAATCFDYCCKCVVHFDLASNKRWVVVLLRPSN